MTEPNPETTASVEMQRFSLGAAPVARTDFVAVEEPLEIRVEGKSLAVIMRTPGQDRELAVGFLLSEGVISSLQDLFEVSLCPSATNGNAVDVILSHPEKLDLSKFSRHVLTSSSCGICGRTSIEAGLGLFPPLGASESACISLETLLSLPDKQREAQAAFKSTGGIHASALFDVDGNMLRLHEDVGRHNAFDKLNGAALLANQFPLHQHVLLLSGRVSHELMQKALAARISIVAAVGAPSSLAVDFAKASGQTLVGFIRDGRCNVYAGAQRISG